jgi:hypothetical protein
MSGTFIRVVARWKSPVGAVLLSASVFGLGCANLGKKIDQALAPVQTSTKSMFDGKTTTGPQEAAKADSSTNKAVAQQKFNAMLEENGLSK